MKSSQAHAKAPTARQVGVARGKASRRATPVDLKQEPIQPRRRRHKSQPFQNATSGTQNTYLASFRKMAGFYDSTSEPGSPSEPARFLLQPQKTNETVRSVRFARTNGDPRNPGMASFRKTAGLSESAPEPGGPSEPARLLLQPQKTSETVKICKIRAYRRRSPEPRNGFVPQNDV